MFWKVILTLIVLILTIYGINLSVQFELVETNEANSIVFKWFSIPILGICIYYSYILAFKKIKVTQTWKNGLVMVLLSIILIIFLFRATQAYILEYNSTIGKNQPKLIKGRIINVYYPRRPRLFNPNKIDVFLEEKKEIVSFRTLDVSYFIGQNVELMMTKGSLGILYKP